MQFAKQQQQKTQYSPNLALPTTLPPVVCKQIIRTLNELPLNLIAVATVGQWRQKPTFWMGRRIFRKLAIYLSPFSSLSLSLPLVFSFCSSVSVSHAVNLQILN